MIRFCLSLLMTTWLFSTEVAAHPGGLDSNCGHTNRKTGEYHCHKAPCNGIHKQVEDATDEALSENRPVTLIYRREDWRHWIDDDGDCMNTRHEILLAQAVGEVKRSPDGCYVSTGTWHDPYSGKTYTRASDLDIDHLITLVYNML